jgi:hypothetical protein
MDTVIEWTALYPDPVVWINVMKLDASWRHDATYYVGRGAAGPGNAKPSKYNRFGKWFSEPHPAVWMPDVGLTDGIVRFSDGRHRFAWLRDHGVRVLPVTVSPEIEAEMRRRFGTKSRRSGLSRKGIISARKARANR